MSYAISLGYACHLAARTRNYARAPLIVLPLWIEPAIWLGQIRFLFNHRGEPVSYFTYAYLSEEVEERIIRDDRVALHISEWKEGTRIWILDMVASPGFLRSTLSLVAELFHHETEIRYLRRMSGGQVKKVVCMTSTGHGIRIRRDA